MSARGEPDHDRVGEYGNTIRHLRVYADAARPAEICVAPASVSSLPDSAEG